MDAKFKSFLDLEDFFNSIGESMISSEEAAEILALYKLGSGNEWWVKDSRMCARLLLAQKKVNIYGGCIPDRQVVDLIEEKYRELVRDGKGTGFLKKYVDRYGKHIRV